MDINKRIENHVVIKEGAHMTTSSQSLSVLFWGPKNASKKHSFTRTVVAVVNETQA